MLYQCSPLPCGRTNTALLAEWDAIRRALEDPAVNLTAEEFAPLLATFAKMRRAGQYIDPMTVALVECLRRQAMDAVEEMLEDGTPEPTEDDGDTENDSDSDYEDDGERYEPWSRNRIGILSAEV